MYLCSQITVYIRHAYIQAFRKTFDQRGDTKKAKFMSNVY